MDEPVEVPRGVYEVVRALQQTGAVNMLHIAAVTRSLREQGFADEAEWIDGNRRLYAQGIFHGIEPSHK